MARQEQQLLPGPAALGGDHEGPYRAELAVICVEPREDGGLCEQPATVALVVDGVAHLLCDADTMRVARRLRATSTADVEVRELRGARTRMVLTRTGRSEVPRKTS